MPANRPSMLSRPTGSIIPMGRDRARMLAWQDALRTDINQKVGPAADPTSSHWIHKHHLGNDFRILFGRIVDAVAYVNAYKVQVEHGSSALWCTSAVHTALQQIGSRQLGQIPVGASVIFALHPADNYGIILGVIPDAQTSSRGTLIDFISQAARSGLLVDSAHGELIRREDASLITDWSAGRPFDATIEGEAGHITETGLLNFIDSFMTAQRVNEMCGLWHFYTDGLTRLAGTNLQIWSAGTEREDVDDEGEVDVVQGYTPYYWEALGAFEFGLTTCREIPTECWQKDEKYQGYSGLEPCSNYQQPFYRLRDFYGYWGQAHKRIVCLPPQVCSSSAFPELHEAYLASSSHCENSCVPEDLDLIHDRLVFPGVFDEDLALTGRWAVRSAHEIILSKHLLIPTPKQIALPQDENGDKVANYKAAGLLGEGQEHEVVADIAIEGADDPNQIRALGFLDTHAFVFEWIGNHPFYYHHKDWFMPDEGDLYYLSRNCHTVAFHVPYYDELACYHMLEAPPPIPLKVDHRYGKVHYYPNHSYMALLTDGGVVIGDGFGSEFKLANGSFWLTAPGDGNIHVGRNVVSFAGHDFIARAKNSWDITATLHDGRLKARNNLWMVASGDAGGILLHSMATKSVKNDTGGERAVMSGITIRADDAQVNIRGQHIANKIIPGADPTASVLVLDTGDEGRIKLRGKYIERFVQAEGGILDFWYDGENVERGTEAWKDGTLFCAPLVVDNKLLVSKTGIFGQDVAILRGHVATKDAGMYMGKVGVVNDPAIERELKAKLRYYKQRCKEELPRIGEQEMDTLQKRQEEFVADNRDFSFRLLDDYKTWEFVLFENRWQQLARLNREETKPWVEESILTTYPYPGRENFEDATFRTLDLNLYDGRTLVAKDRNSLYEDPKFDKPKHKSLQTYPVIM